MWNRNDEMVGQRVIAYDLYDESFNATIVAVSTETNQIKVRDDETGEILIGNQWEPID